jgi:hypothetical protein
MAEKNSLSVPFEKKSEIHRWFPAPGLRKVPDSILSVWAVLNRLNNQNIDGLTLT